VAKVSNIIVSSDLDDGKAVAEFNDWLKSTEAVGALAEVTSFGGWKQPEWSLYAGVLNNASLAEVVNQFARTNWRFPEYAQLWLRDEEEDFFSFWMFRGGKLSRMTPLPAAVDEEVYPRGASSCRLQLASADDVDFLKNLAARGTWLFPDELPAFHDVGADRRRDVRDVPVAIVALREVPRDDPTDWFWQRVAAGLLWIDRSNPSSAYVALMVPEQGRQYGIESALLRRLCDIARAASVSELVYPFLSSDEWTKQAYLDFGFTSEVTPVSGRLRKLLCL
jgi:hypothetical protein